MSPKKDKLLSKAETYAREKKVKKAITLYKQAIELDPGDIRTRLRVSELLYQSGRSQEALDILQYVGDYYREHGFLLKSVAVYKKMLEVDPTRTDLHGVLAQLYFQLGMAPDAIRQFKAQIRALLKQGRVRDGLHVIRSMLELDPANVSDRLRLAEQFSAVGLIDEAATEYRRVLRLLEKKGRKEDWKKVALRYLHHNPDDFGVRKKVVESLIEEEDFYHALQHLHASFLKEPQDTQLLEMAASAFDNLGQPAKSIVALKSLATIYRQKGLGREEQDVYSRVLQLDPKDEVARAGLGMTDADEVPKGEVELEWDMPDDYRAAEEVGTDALDPDEFGASSFTDDDVSFDEEWAEEKTLVEAVSDDVFEELMKLESSNDDLGELEDFRVEKPQIDMALVKRRILAARPMTVEELENAGVRLTPGEQEELEFFLSAQLDDEALTILREVHGRLTQEV